MPGANDNLTKRWNAGEPAFSLWLGGTSTATVEAVSAIGYDSLLFDLQHTPLDLRDLETALLAMEGAGPTPLVRAPWNDPSTLMKILDLGACGVICPMINTAAQAADLVAACRYPPHGQRSFGPMRRRGRSPGEYFADASNTTAVIAQIETVEAVENVAAITATPGIDAIFIGSNDLAISAGEGPGIRLDEPVVADRHRRVIDAAHVAGVKVMMVAYSRAHVETQLEWGVDCLALGRDVELVTQAASQALDVARAELSRRAR